MWYGLKTTSAFDIDLEEAASELLRSTFHILIYAVGGLAMLLYLIVNVSARGTSVIPVTYVLLVIAGATALAWILKSDHLLTAQIVWLLGLALSIPLAIHLFQAPGIAVLGISLPLLGSVLIGWPGGILAEGALIAILLWISRSRWMIGYQADFLYAVAAGGLVAAVLGWAATRAMLTVSEWALFSYKRAQQEIEEAREQRLELKQIQEDLLLSNRELARLSNRLKTMHRIAEEARRAKEEFVANVSHELRTPLNMIIGFSDMIMQMPQIYGDQIPQPLLADVSAIQRNSQHLSKLVNDVLDLSQIEADQMMISKEWVDVAEVIEEACQTVSALFEQKGLYLRTNIPDTLPTLRCDRTRIRQVIINLLSNAGRFTEHGGVVVRAKLEKSHVAISVIDTGPGITAEDQKRLFQPFQQVDSSIRRQYEGTGLGLAISKRFVEMHGGQIKLESEVDVGTTITFTLPRETPPQFNLAGEQSTARWFHPYDEHTYNPRTRGTKAPVPKPTPKFVLVEPGETLQRLIGRYAPHVETVSTSTTEEALDVLSQSPAQAMIINSPPILEQEMMVQQLQNLPYGTPAMHCWVPTGDEAYKALGVKEYVVKPVTREKLLSILETFEEEAETILLVDDDPEVLRLFSRVIASSPHRYRILQAPNGQRALDLMRERGPDLVLIDLIMPGMSGHQVLIEKHRDPEIRSIPVVILSSRDPQGHLNTDTTLTIACSGGMTTRNLVKCMQEVSQIIAPMKERRTPESDGSR